MVYCYECGEQVAENDVFCPYCGITLSPLTVGENDEPATSPDDAPNFDAAENFAAERQNTDFANDVTAENLDLSAEFAPVSPDNAQTEASKSDFAPRFDQSAEFGSGAASPKLEKLEPIEESPAKTAVSEESAVFMASDEQNLQKPVAEINPEPTFVETAGETGKSSESEDLQTESSLMEYEEAEIKEIPSPDEPEISVDEIEDEIQSSVADNADVSDSKHSALDALTENSAPADIEAAPIKMPSINLPDEEKSASPRFDSVSIMEEPAPIADEISNVAEIIPAQSPLIAKTAIAAEEKSYTQPNLVGDTDWKSKKKLKTLDEGTVLNNRYEIVRKIGGGGMGAVYLASDKNLGGVLRAVKEMVQSYIGEAEQDKAVNDFKRESLLLTSLDHQSIPTIYDYFFDEKEARFYLVMKYISGGDLSSRLRSAPTGRVDEAEVTRWAIQITDVLDYLHNRQPPIVYRDLKPANVMIDGNSGRTMLIDFGIARWVNKEEKGVTAVGTMGYAPPELFSGNVEARSDIYSLGSTMFHLLTGADPQSNPLLIFDFQKNPRPRQINPQLSDQMERILMRSVEYNADKRFTSAAEMRKTLEEHLENLQKGNVTYGVKEAPASIALSDQPVFCGFCGRQIVATDMFCAFCGAKQPLAQQGVHSESYSPTALTAQLLVIGTHDLEQPSFRLEKEENLVGRRDPQSNIFPEVDLSKYDPQTKVSRRHARIWREGSEFMVEDLGSSNGTYLLPVISDTVRLQPRQPQLLTNGDKIRLGDTTLHFILG